MEEPNFSVQLEQLGRNIQMFSLIETAKENGLDPYRYLVYILKTAPNLDQTADNWTAPLLPQNAPDDCMVPK